MELVGKHRLVAHPDHPPKSVRTVDVSVWSGSHMMLRYAVEPAGSLVLPEHGVERVDGLWRSTCFELFVKTAGGAAYDEFNFAPLFAWNAYSFSDWRKGMTPLDVADEPHLVDCRVDDRRSAFPGKYELDVVLAPNALGKLPGARMSLTTIIEETDGSMSYWALCHPAGPPDFHQAACFVAVLPPIAGG